MDSGSDRSRSRSRSPSRGRMRVGTRVEARYRYDSAFTLQLPPFTGRFVGAGARSIRARSRGSTRTALSMSPVCAVFFEAPSTAGIDRTPDSSRGFDGLITQTTTARARLGSRRASSRRSAAGAATPIAGRQTNCAKVTPSRRDIGAARSIIPARLIEIDAMGPTILPTTMGNERRGSRPGSSARSVGVAGAGAGPGVAARRGAACVSVRAWRHDTGTDSASKLQLP